MLHRLLVAAAVLGLVAFAPAPFPKSAPSGSLDGWWERLSFQRLADKGKPFASTRTFLHIEGDTLTYYHSAKPGELRKSIVYKIKTDSKAKPPTFDVMWSDGMRPSSLGIYKIEGDTLVRSYLPSSTLAGARPASFTLVSPSQILMTLRRLKKPPK